MVLHLLCLHPGSFLNNGSFASYVTFVTDFSLRLVSYNTLSFALLLVFGQQFFVWSQKESLCFAISVRKLQQEKAVQ